MYSINLFAHCKVHDSLASTPAAVTHTQVRRRYATENEELLYKLIKNITPYWMFV